MKPIIITTVFLTAAWLPGQTRVDLTRQGKTADFSLFPQTKPATTGSVLPETCSTGEVFLLLFNADGRNIHVCTATNVWKAQTSLPSVAGNTGKVLSSDGISSQWLALGGDLTGLPTNVTVAKLQGRIVSAIAPQNGQALVWNQTAGLWEGQTVAPGSGSGVTIKSSTATIGTTGTLKFSSGFGMGMMLTDTGTGISIQPSVDSAVMATRSGVQNAESLQCVSTGSTGMSFSCGLSPSLGAYTTGMTILWRPDAVSNGTPATLDVDALGPKEIRLADGVLNPQAGEFKAGEMYPLWYDGISFRLTGVYRKILGEAATLPNCTGSERGRILFIPGATGVADELKLCAKTIVSEVEVFEWRTLIQ